MTVLKSEIGNRRSEVRNLKNTANHRGPLRSPHEKAFSKAESGIPWPMRASAAGEIGKYGSADAVSPVLQTVCTRLRVKTMA